MNKIIKILMVFCLILSICSCSQQKIALNNEKTAEIRSNSGLSATDDEMQEKKLESEEKQKEIEIPSTFDVQVPFAPQAPFANWDLPYQEACEEASLIMAYKYFANEPLNKKIMDDEIKDLVDWQLEKLGHYTDTDLKEVEFIANEYFGLNTEISIEVTEENIKKQLILGNLIIIPASGRDLDNPNFTEPGPIFHMLVIRGYDRNEFITNDPGTRNGWKFKYKYDNLIEAVHDLGKFDKQVFRPYEQENISDKVKLQKMRSGPKQMLIIKGLEE